MTSSARSSQAGKRAGFLHVGRRDRAFAPAKLHNLAKKYLDLKRPEADGFAVLEHLKNNPEWAVIPTVVLTASQDLDDIKKAYMLGASSYHVKPTSFEGLQKQLKVLHEYWMTCEVPEVDSAGRQLRTDSKGKLGERFNQP